MNGWIVKLNTMGTHVIPTTRAPFDEEREVARFRWRASGEPV